MVLAGCRIDGDEVRRRWPGLHEVDTTPPRSALGRELGAGGHGRTPFARVARLARRHRTSHWPMPHPLAGHRTPAPGTGFGRPRSLPVVAGKECEYPGSSRRYPPPMAVSDSALTGGGRFVAGRSPLDGRPTDREASQTGPQGRQRLVAVGHVPAGQTAREPDAGCRGEYILRLLDASANRGREALRVVEDYARFVLDDAHLTGCLKVLRHDLTAALACLPMVDRLAMRVRVRTSAYG